MEIGRYTAGFLIVLLLSIIFGVFVVDYEKEAISDEMNPVIMSVASFPNLYFISILLSFFCNIIM